MLAQQMPRPIIGRSVSAWLSMLARRIRESPARASVPACTRLPPMRWTSGSRNSAEIIVTKLYEPFISPVQAAASS